MLNDVQNRNYTRGQKLHLFLDANHSVYTKYVPFNKETHSFKLDFNLFKKYVTEKQTDGTEITQEQKDLKNKLAETVADICNTATVYAEQYDQTKLAASLPISKSHVIKQKDPDVYGLVLTVVHTLKPLLSDAHFMKYDITAAILDTLMNDAKTFRDNISKSSFIESGDPIANQNINEVIKGIDKNIKTFDKLIHRFAATHPDFVAGYRINAALEGPATRHTGITGIVTSEATGKPVPDALVVIKDTNKETITGRDSSYSIRSMYGRSYDIVVSAAGYETKIIPVRVSQGKIYELNIAL